MPYEDYHDILNSNNNFDAHLRDETGRLFEVGHASVYANNDAVDFISEFVPLMDMHTRAHIIKVMNDRECHVFSGNVYLSSKTRLQISNVTDRLLSYQEMLIAQRVKLTGVAHSIVFIPSIYEGGEASKQLNSSEIEIFSISIKEIAFTVPKSYAVAEQLLISINPPVNMDDVEIRVYRQLQFSPSKTMCYATIDATTPDSRRNLIRYLINNLIVFN